MYYAITLFESRQRFGIIFLALSVVLSCLTAIKGKKLLGIKSERWHNLVVGICITVAIVTGIFFYTQFMHLVWERCGQNMPIDYVMGVLIIIMVFICTWKEMGPILPVITLVFIAYGYFGNYFPGFLYHPGLSPSRLVQLFAVEIDGIYGTLNQIGCTWIVIFVFYAGFIRGFGGLKYVLDITTWFGQKFKYGLTQMLLIASMLFGCFSGSAAANVAGTGSFTIPTMKGVGIPPKYAGAIESVASSGGQVMPPIMGAAAFVMCNYLNVHYIKVVAYGLAPAIVFYLSVAIAVYLISLKYLQVEKIVVTEVPHISIAEGMPILISIIALVAVLAITMMDILTVGFFTIILFLILRLILELKRSWGVNGLKNFGKGLIEGIRAGSLSMVSIAVMLGIMGIILRVLTGTGLAQTLAFFMVDISGGHLVPLLLLIMLVCIIFGMAVSTVAAYILVVILAAPALIMLGVPLLSAHFTVFYLAITSAITPPVAAACAVACGIAKAPFLSVCWQAMKIGVGIFILPFVFVTQPDILAFSSATPLAALIVLIGLIAITLGIHGPWGGAKGGLKRFIYIILGGLGLFCPVSPIAYACLGVAVLLFAYDLTRGRRVKAVAVAENNKPSLKP